MHGQPSQISGVHASSGGCTISCGCHVAPCACGTTVRLPYCPASKQSEQEKAAAAKAAKARAAAELAALKQAEEEAARREAALQELLRGAATCICFLIHSLPLWQ